MSGVTRFTVSIEADLFDQFSLMSGRRGWGNRSEAIRMAIRDALVREEWEGDEEIVGTITLVYDHHQRELNERLTRIQHDHHQAVIALTHVHLDHDNCLEMIAVRGTASQVQRIANELMGTRGVKHGKLTATTTGRTIR